MREARSQARGLLYLALLVLAIVMLRTYFGQTLGPGWWRLW